MLGSEPADKIIIFVAVKVESAVEKEECAAYDILEPMGERRKVEPEERTSKGGGSRGGVSGYAR